VKILLVSQMYPGREDPDLGVFVAQLAEALAARGHLIDRAVLDTRAGGSLRYLTLGRRALAADRPDVVYAHFLVPSGLIGALAQPRVPLVVTAHGHDVANVGSIPGIAALTRLTVRRAAAVVAVSDYLRRALEVKVPEARGKTEVVDCGVDVERFSVLPRPSGEPAFLCLGSLTPRKNVLRLAAAFERLGTGTLTFAGAGPLERALERRKRVHVLPPVPHEEVPALIGEAHVVCGPSLVEPFGQALLEAMACGRPVVATRVGGPPEFVTAGSGILVDPQNQRAIEEALRAALELPCPSPAARATAEAHDVRLQAERVEAILERAVRGRPA
jgi:glycosyltransferase involved in cell wall biosynthesis